MPKPKHKIPFHLLQQQTSVYTLDAEQFNFYHKCKLENEILMIEELIEGHRDAISRLEDTIKIVQANIKQLEDIETGRL